MALSVLEQIRKLDEQKAQLLESAKQEAIKAANDAIATLNELGFDYSLTQGSTSVSNGKTTAAREPGTRRTGIREEVLAVIEKNPSITRSALLETMEAKGNKSAEQSVSNALSALKKAGTITADEGAYSAR